MTLSFFSNSGDKIKSDCRASHKTEKIKDSTFSSQEQQGDCSAISCSSSDELNTLECSSLSSISSYELYRDVNCRNPDKSFRLAPSISNPNQNIGTNDNPIYQRPSIPRGRRKLMAQSAWSPPIECSEDDNSTETPYTTKDKLKSVSTYSIPHVKQETKTDISTSTYTVPDQCER